MGSKLDEVMKNINKSAKDNILSKGLDDYDYKRIPFTSPRLNYCTFGGLPEGKLIEFYGEDHGGKTTTALDVIANYQRLYPDRSVALIDAENTLDLIWAEKLGVNVDDLYILHPKAQSAEEIFQIIIDMVETGEVGLWVLDSIGALLSQQEYEKSVEEKTYGGVAKPLTLFGKKIEMLMHKYNCTGIGINQEREDLQSQWGGTKTPGGKAWKHFCSVRLRFSRGKYLDADGNELNNNAENPAGNVVVVNMVKNKTCPPTRRVGRYRLSYEHGVDYIKDLVDVALFYGIINKRGSWFDILDPNTGEIMKEKIQGQANVYKALEKDQELLDWMDNLVNELLSPQSKKD